MAIIQILLITFFSLLTTASLANVCDWTTQNTANCISLKNETNETIYYKANDDTIVTLINNAPVVEKYFGSKPFTFTICTDQDCKNAVLTLQSTPTVFDPGCQFSYFRGSNITVTHIEAASFGFGTGYCQFTLWIIQ